ncbi:MAG: hypothetical protein C7B45_16190, partial [Sulfobacillus acidophilus]
GRPGMMRSYFVGDLKNSFACYIFPLLVNDYSQLLGTPRTTDLTNSAFAPELAYFSAQPSQITIVQRGV